MKKYKWGHKVGPERHFNKIKYIYTFLKHIRNLRFIQKAMESTFMSDYMLKKKPKKQNNFGNFFQNFIMKWGIKCIGYVYSIKVKCMLHTIMSNMKKIIDG